MFKKDKPFKDAELNPEPPQRDFQDFLELVGGFLWFYHKTILGIILLIAVGIFCYRLATSPKVAESAPSTATQRSDRSDVPSASLDFNPSTDTVADSTKANKQAEVPAADAKETESTRLASDPPESSASRLLKNGSVEQLIEESLKIRDTWGGNRPIVGLMMCSERAKISRRLLELELTDAQRTFALASYIESISLVDSLNVASKMGMDGTRKALMEIDEKYSNHADPTIHSKANLAMTLAPLYDYIASDNLEHLYAFQSEFETRLEKIEPDQASLVRLAELTIAMYNKPDLAEERGQVVLNLMHRLDALESPLSKQVADRFQERYLFDKFELRRLPDLIRLDNEQTREKVQQFFQTLADNPDMGQVIYQHAINVVQTFQSLEQKQDANALLNWLNDIADNISKEQDRLAVKRAISEMKMR